MICMHVAIKMKQERIDRISKFSEDRDREQFMSGESSVSIVIGAANTAELSIAEH